MCLCVCVRVSETSYCQNLKDCAVRTKDVGGSFDLSVYWWELFETESLNLTLVDVNVPLQPESVFQQLAFCRFLQIWTL